MFCQKCGKEFKDGEKFCTACGNPAPEAREVSENAATIEGAAAETVNTAETQSAAPQNEVSANTPQAFDTPQSEVSADAPQIFGTPIGGNKKKITKIAVIAAAAVVLVCGIVKCAPYISNTASKITMSPSKYFGHVIKKNAKTTAKSLSNIVGNAKSYDPGNAAATGKISVEKGSAFDDVITNAGGSAVLSYINWLDEIELDIDTVIKDNATATTGEIEVNGEDLGTIDFVMDMDNKTFCFGMPDYNSDYISTSFDMDDIAPFGNTQMTEDINNLVKAIPSKAVTEKIIYRYVSTAAKQIDKVEESKGKLEVGGVTQKCTKLEATIDGETFANITKATLEELRDDKDIKKIVSDISASSSVFADLENDYNEAMAEIDSVIAATDDLRDLEETVIFSCWVNSKGEIIGIELNIDGAVAYVKSTQKGHKFGWELCVAEADGGFSLSGGGKVSGNKRSGEFSLKVMGMEIAEIKVKKLNLDKLENDGIFNGTVAVRVADGLPLSQLGDGAEILNGMELVLKSDTDSTKEANFECGLYYNDELCVNVDFSATERKASKIKMPKNRIDVENSSAMEDWAKNFDFDKLLKRLRDTGIPNNMMNQIEDGINEIR